MVLQIARLVAVLALLCVAAAIATPKGRLPLALRGLAKMLRSCDVEKLRSCDTSQPPNLSTSQHLNLTWEQFRFTLPLSLGGFLLMTSPLVIAAFIGRTANAADMLAVHYVALGVVNPVAYAAVRMQAVAIQFRPEYPGDRRLLTYALIAGALLGLIPLAFFFPAIGDWYFGVYQNVPPRILGLARTLIGIFSFVCIIQAVRGRVEGIAAAEKCPKAVMVGQIAYTTSLFFICVILLPFGCAGWVMSATAVILSPICTICAIYVVLKFACRKKAQDMV